MVAFTAPVDFLVVAPLAEERNALLSLLDGWVKLPPNEEDIRFYYAAHVPAAHADGSELSYTVVVTSPNNMGHTEAANVTSDGIRRWCPRYVILVGIAGGIGEEVQLGDVLVSDQIVDYEMQKVRDTGSDIRWQIHRADPRLLAAAGHFNEPAWDAAVVHSRPTAGAPTVHIGPICTGNKVLADGRLAKQYKSVWKKLIGVEMEAGGAASATLQSAGAPGFLMVRGVSDLANPEKDTEATQKWRAYACSVAAAYLVAFLRSGPVPKQLKHSRPRDADDAARLLVATVEPPSSAVREKDGWLFSSADQSFWVVQLWNHGERPITSLTVRIHSNTRKGDDLTIDWLVSLPGKDDDWWVLTDTDMFDPFGETPQIEVEYVVQGDRWIFDGVSHSRLDS